MAEQDENDIIIAIGSAIQKYMAQGGAEFSVDFATIEKMWKVPQGSVTKHLEQAAKDVGVEVVRQGSSSALLRKKRSGPLSA